MRAFLVSVAVIFTLANTSAFAVGQWMVDKKTGCKVWNVNPEPNESITWSGPCDNYNKYADGSGTVQWYKSKVAGDKYVGNYSEGNMGGQGIYYYDDGVTFEGRWAYNNLYEGVKYFKKKGMRMEGTWDYFNRVESGKGIIKWDNGMQFQGGWIDDLMSGKGEMIWPDGKHYNGDWVNGEGSGQCKLSWKNGDQYYGTCQKDQPYNGVSVLANGKVFDYKNSIPKERDSIRTTTPTPPSQNNSFGTMLTAAIGAVVAHKTGDFTLLNQAVQEANDPTITTSTKSDSATTSNIGTNYYSDVTHGLNSNCISIGSGTHPSYNNSSEIEFINNCGKYIDLFYGNPGKMSSVSMAIGIKKSVSFYGNAKTMKIAVCPGNYNAVKPNFRQIIESGRGQNSAFMWDAENSFICWKSPQP